MRAAAFWWRLLDNLFRRIVWFLLPVLALTAVGVMQAGKTLELFESSGTMSATSNPLVPDQQTTVTGAQFWETPAEATSRTINEQLRTDAFLLDVATRAGVAEAVEANVITLEVVRESVWAVDDGNSLVKVNATWADPTTAFALANGVIDTYFDFVASTVASDATEAEAFYMEQQPIYETRLAQAQADLDAFVASVTAPGADEQVQVVTDLQLSRLTAAVAAAETELAELETNIENAQLEVTLSRSEAGRSLTVIDAPAVPSNPESTIVQRAATVISFGLLGAVISLAILLLTTMFDKSVVSPADLAELKYVGSITVVPELPLGEGRPAATNHDLDDDAEPDLRSSEREKAGV